MEKKQVIKVSKSVATVSEFDALLESYKVQSPAKYEAGLASGEFDRFRATLINDKKKEEPKEEKVAKEEKKKK